LYLQAVYEEDLIHRQPGVLATLDQFERKFPVTEQWVGEETSREEDGAGGDSFTRIVIGELKPEVLRDIGSPSGREQLCK
jgi:hypothetical protein